MNDETQVTQDVADGQSVVDAVAIDTQNIVNGAVDQIGVMLQQQSDAEGVATTCEIGAAQWQEFQGYARLASTSAMLNAFACMAVFGAVCAGYFVKGWRRG